MSLTRNNSVPPAGVRDVEGDYVNAYLEQLAVYRSAGLTDKANEVVAVLRQYGVEVGKVPTGAKERAVTTDDAETATPAEPAAPKRRRNPKAE